MAGQKEKTLECGGMEARLKTDKAVSKVLHLSKILNNQETCFELSWMPTTHCARGEGGMHFETYIFCLSEMSSLS